MEVSGEHRFAADRLTVWKCLLDPQSLKAAIPGCDELNETGPDAYALTIRVGIAAIKGTYQGSVSVADQVPHESYRLVVSGEGKPGGVQGDALMTLSESDSGTLLRYRGDVKARGAIARMGNRLLGGVANLMVGQFMKGMDEQVRRAQQT